MRDYGGFWYKPDYGYAIYKEGQRVSYSNKVAGAACFSRVFNFFDGKTTQEFEGVYTLRCRKEFKKGSGNYCSLDKDQVLKMLRYMRTTFKINTKLAETNDNYVIRFKIEGKPIKHKFILTFSRVFFEYPYNEIARDVFKWRQAGPINGRNYCNKSFLELYNRALFTYSNWGYGHTLFYYPSLEINPKTILQIFDKGAPQVCDVLRGDNTLANKLKRLRIHDWDSDFEERAVVYAENFQILKDIKDAKNKKGVRRRARKVVRKVDK